MSQGAIQFVTGDATAPIGSGPRVIAHVVNTEGGWGRGFVVAVSKRWARPEQIYRSAFRAGELALGAVQFVNVETGLWVANMAAQVGYRQAETEAEIPLRYPALRECLWQVRMFAHQHEQLASVHIPRIGCGLAGGTWDKVEPIVCDELVSVGVDVTVYDLPEREK
jgi:O-acetyl-ADP-ribose deacetylase (regulator of RNase III)